MLWIFIHSHKVTPFCFSVQTVHTRCQRCMDGYMPIAFGFRKQGFQNWIHGYVVFSTLVCYRRVMVVMGKLFVLYDEHHQLYDAWKSNNFTTDWKIGLSTKHPGCC